MSGYVSKEAIRVKVKKCESNVPSEWRKFSVDPQITTVEVLCSIVAKAFDIKSDFSISYRAVDPNGQEQYLAVLSDWDLDAAFLRTHNQSIQCLTEPCLNLRVDVKPFSEANVWESYSPAIGCPQGKSEPSLSLQQSIGMGQKYVQNMQTKLPGLIMNQMEKTFSLVQRALNMSEEQIPIYPPRPPLSDTEFRGFLDSVGQILKPQELRRVIFLGGIDPSLRRVVWKHILNVYPNGMTGRQRMDYMKRKAMEYYKLREVWKTAVQKGPVNGELAYVTGMVRKDVLRTDRLHPFYAGSDDNQNIASLFNILTTFALNHPSVSYCQGMSDIASPLLVTMNDEAHAYICFCAIMSRLKANFMLDGISMTRKFAHLTEALQFYDPEFFDYLKSQQADDLLFCYRWLLLELKREFPFEDSLRMLEVQWSSLRIEFLDYDLKLIEKEFIPPTFDGTLTSSSPPTKSPTVVMRKPRESNYVKVCALRRQSSSASLSNSLPGSMPNGKLDGTRRLNHSLDENATRNKIKVKSNQSLDEAKMLQIAIEKIAIFESPKDDVEDVPEVSIPQVGRLILHPTNPFLDENILEDLVKTNSSSLFVENWLGNGNNFTTTETCESETNETKNNATGIENNAYHNNNEYQSTITFHRSDQKLSISDHDISNSNERFEKLSTSESEPKISEISVSPKKDSKLILNKKTIMKNSSNNKITASTGHILQKQLYNSNIRKGHFKDLKDKIAASKKGILASLDKMDLEATEEPSQKIVKNFNEFLNFASINKNRSFEKANQSHEKNSNFLKVAEAESSVTVNTQDAEKENSLGKLAHDISGFSEVQNHGHKPLQLQLTNIVAQTQQNLSIDTGSSPDDSQDYYPMTTSITRELRLDMENLDRQVFGNRNLRFKNEVEYEALGTLDLVDVKQEEIVSIPESVDSTKRISACSTDQFIWENPLHQISNLTNELDEIPTMTNGNQMTPDEQQDLEYDGEIILENSVQPLRLVKRLQVQRKDDSDDSDGTESNWKQSDNFNPFIKQFDGNSLHIIDNTFVKDNSAQIGEEAEETAVEINTNHILNEKNLPTPKEFGGGNPFLMFLCLTLLLQHRNTIIKNAMDYNEIAMHFDKMIRKHDVNKVLNQARRMYFEYLKAQNLMLKKNNSGSIGFCHNDPNL